MGHYEIGEWTDFVRNLLAKQQQAEMEQHQAICAECRDIVALLAKVNAAAQAETRYDAATGELAKAARRIFSKQRAGGRALDLVAGALTTLAAHLTYDSAFDLQPIGARSRRPDTRRMLYEAGDYCIDLSFEGGPGSIRVTLVGQVSCRKEPIRHLEKLPVLVVSGSKVVTQTASNEFGEFAVEYAPRRDLRLCVPISDAGFRLEIPLKPALEEHET